VGLVTFVGQRQFGRYASVWYFFNLGSFEFQVRASRDRVQVQSSDSNLELNAGESSALLPEDAPAKPNLLATLITLFGGMALWAVITFVLHAKVVGVAPLA